MFSLRPDCLPAGSAIHGLNREGGGAIWQQLGGYGVTKSDVFFKVVCGCMSAAFLVASQGGPTSLMLLLDGVMQASSAVLVLVSVFGLFYHAFL